MAQVRPARSQARTVQRLSPAGLRVFGDMVSGAHRPRVLHDAFVAGSVPVQDPPELIAFA